MQKEGSVDSAGSRLIRGFQEGLGELLTCTWHHPLLPPAADSATFITINLGVKQISTAISQV